MPTQHYSAFEFLDRSNEKSTFKVFNGAITAVSIAGFLTDFGALKAATAAITRGEISREAWTGDNTTFAVTPPDDNFAQRESKFLVTYQGDTSAKLFTTTIPTADLEVVTFGPNSDDLVLDDAGVVAAFVTAFEQLARTPDSDQETVTVIRIRAVGRNI